MSIRQSFRGCVNLGALYGIHFCKERASVRLTRSYCATGNFTDDLNREAIRFDEGHLALAETMEPIWTVWSGRLSLPFMLHLALNSFILNKLRARAPSVPVWRNGSATDL